MFISPRGDKTTVEWQSDYDPIELPGINKNDFEQLIRVPLRKYVVGKSPESSFSRDQWISVLDLSTKWEFRALRTAAINHLTTLNGSIDPVDKLVMAIKYKITEWMLPTLLKLAQRAEPISVDEGNRMGLETALKLSAVREKVKLPCGQCQTCAWHGNNGRLVVGERDPMTRGLDFTPLIQTTLWYITVTVPSAGQW